MLGRDHLSNMLGRDHLSNRTARGLPGLPGGKVMETVVKAVTATVATVMTAFCSGCHCCHGRLHRVTSWRSWWSSGGPVLELASPMVNSPRSSFPGPVFFSPQVTMKREGPSPRPGGRGPSGPPKKRPRSGEKAPLPWMASNARSGSLLALLGTGQSTGSGNSCGPTL